MNRFGASILALAFKHDKNTNPVSGRILLCAVGPNAEWALQTVESAQIKWPSASSLFDLDGAPIIGESLEAAAA